MVKLSFWVDLVVVCKGKAMGIGLCLESRIVCLSGCCSCDSRSVHPAIRFLQSMCGISIIHVSIIGFRGVFLFVCCFV